MYHISKLFRFIIYFGILAGSVACSSNKPVIYLADMNPGVWYEAPRQVETIVNPNDLLEIIVACNEPALAAPFNIGSAWGTNGAVGTDAAGEGRVVRHDAKGGYRVDGDGYILFPILGRLKVKDLTYDQVAQLIADKIVAGGYITEPQVSCRLTSFKFSVLGAVAKNGVYEADGGRITLLEAIAGAGDLTSKAKVDRVMVIREENGLRVSVAHDLRSMEIFDSPFFYLKPNDVVYVEPRYDKRDNEDRGTQYFSLLLGLATVVTSVIWILAK